MITSLTPLCAVGMMHGLGNSSVSNLAHLVVVAVLVIAVSPTDSTSTSRESSVQKIPSLVLFIHLLRVAVVKMPPPPQLLNFSILIN